MTTGWSTTGFADIADLVRARTGLVFPDARLRDVETTINRTMARLGTDSIEDLLVLLRDDAAAREEFVADLTIGESYFQRDPAQFDLLRSRVLPELLASRPHDRPIRVWSAGCASGEEPYTVAMQFEELDAADRGDIVGTDIARARLADAQRGLYSKWQLRSTPDAVRRRYFAERGRYFELSPRIRRLVDFRYLNLAEDTFPSLSTGIWGMDVILCRNVLIYFDRPTIERVAQQLIASLSEDGWLLLGASDPAIAEMVDCDVVLTDSGLVYRRRGAAHTPDIRHVPGGTPFPADAARAQTVAPAGPVDTPIEPDVQPESTPPFVTHPDPAAIAPAPEPSDASSPKPTDAVGPVSEPAILEAYAVRDFERVRELAQSASRSGTMSAACWTAWVRALANEGRHDEAAATVTRAVDQAGATPELLYLHAVVLLQGGGAAAAAAAARRALYLDRSLIVAHLTLAEALRRVGDVAGERRSLRNAAALLDALDAHAVVHASDGEAAGRLAELVRVKLGLLGE